MNLKARSEQTKPSWFAKTVDHLVILALIGLATVTLVGFAGQQGQWFDIFANFRACYVVLLSIVALILCCRRRMWSTIFALTMLVTNMVPIVPLYFGVTAEKREAPAIRILELNIFGGKNTNRAPTIELITRSDADLVGISEVTRPWMLSLQEQLKQYPYQVFEPRFGGVALLSKLPLKDAQVRYFGELQRPRVTAHTTIQGRNVQIIFAHPVIPLYRAGSRDEELIVLSNEAKASKASTILFGDLNATPWSYNFKKLLTDGGLKDSECGFGFQPTWCAFLSPFSMLFPIDHCLVSNDFVVRDRKICENIGSDHLPLQVDLSFTK